MSLIKLEMPANTLRFVSIYQPAPKFCEDQAETFELHIPDRMLHPNILEGLFVSNIGCVKAKSRYRPEIGVASVDARRHWTDLSRADAIDWLEHASKRGAYINMPDVPIQDFQTFLHLRKVEITGERAKHAHARGITHALWIDRLSLSLEDLERTYGRPNTSADLYPSLS